MHEYYANYSQKGITVTRIQNCMSLSMVPKLLQMGIQIYTIITTFGVVRFSS